MSISTISSASSSAAGGGANTAQFEQQIKTLENQIKQENASKTDDAKTKAEKIEQLNLQIQQIQMQMQQQAQAAARNTTVAAKSAGQSTLLIGARLDIKA